MKHLAKLISILLVFSMFTTCIYGIDNVYADETDDAVLQNDISKESLIDNLLFKDAMIDEDDSVTLIFGWDAINTSEVNYEAAIYTVNDIFELGDIVDGTKTQIDKTTNSINFKGLNKDTLYYLQIVPYTEDEEGNKTYDNTKKMTVPGMYVSSPEINKDIVDNNINISFSSPTTVGTKKYIIEYTNGGTPITLVTDKTTETISGLDREKETVINVCTLITVNGLEFKSSSNEVKVDPYFEKLDKVNLSIEPYNKGAILSWKAVKGATSYEVWRYYNSKWSKIKTLSGTNYTNTGLSVNKTYKYKVRAVRKVDNKNLYGEYSNTLGIVAKVYLTGDIKMGYHTGTIIKPAKKYKAGSNTKIESKGLVKVGTKFSILERKKINGILMVHIKVNNNSKKYWVKSGNISYGAPYTTKDYTTQTKERFVNEKGYSSKTKYLLFICNYTQKVYLFQGKKGEWDLKSTYKCATGKASTRTPRGVFKIYKKSTRTALGSKYVTYFKSSNAFHARPAGSTTMSRPASNGCIRMYDKDAIYIYKNIPKYTTVVSY